MKESNNATKMGTAPVLSLIMTMSLPAMFSMLVQSMYNIVDRIFVAQVGENALTAVSLAFPIQNLIIAVGVGTGVGLNSVISRRLGEKRQEEANSAASHGFYLALTSAIFFAIFGALTTKPFFQAFTNDAEVVTMGCDYLYVVTILSFGSLIQIAMEKILQATGNMFYPMMFQLVGALTNIALDPILIFGLLGFPKMGVTGAAVATVIGQIFAMIFSIVVVLFKDHDVHVRFKGFRPNWDTIKNIYAVGVPSMVMQAIGSLLMTLINGILIGFSGAAVSVFGVYNSLQSFVLMPVFGLTQGLMPIMGYNYGAGNKKRLMQIVKSGVAIAAGIMVMGTAIFLIFPEALLRMFNSTPEMMSIGVVALRILCLSFLFASVSVVLSTMFQALGNGVYSLFISATRQLIIILPVAYFMASFYGLNQVWMAMPIAECFAFVFSLILYRRVYRKKIAPMSESAA